MNGSDVENITLPDGRRLERDAEFGFLKVVPRPSDEELAEHYASRYRSSDRPHDPARRVALIRRLHPGPGRVLDIGCGEGELLEEFARCGWEVVGVEPGAESAAVARRKGVFVLDAMMTEALLSDLGTFHVVMLAHVLEHLPNPVEMIGWARRLLLPGGLLYGEVPNDFNAFQQAAVKTQNRRAWWIALPDHLNYFNVESLTALLAGHDFDIVLTTTDFPMELFLLQGDNYVDDPQIGACVHEKRCRFETALRQAGYGGLLEDFYGKLAELGLGRQAMVCARKV